MHPNQCELDAQFTSLEVPPPTEDELHFLFECGGDALGILKAYKDEFRTRALELLEAGDYRRRELEKRTWDRDCDGFTDECESLLLQEIASNHSIIALIAPLAEQVVHDIAKSLEESPLDRDIKDDFLELLEKVNKRETLPDSFLPMWSALLRFRNKALHKVVWTRGQLEAFQNDVHRDEWFEKVTIHFADETTVERFLISRQFVEQAFEEIEKLAHAFCEDPCKASLE